MVSANCLNNWPLMPGRNAVGTNTAIRTTVMLITGASTSFIALTVASLGGRWSRFMTASTFSTTTIASSTTMPMATTRPKSTGMLTEKPKSFAKKNVPMIETGIANMGIRLIRMLPRKMTTTASTSTSASMNV
jgi:hypothetical protein